MKSPTVIADYAGTAGKVRSTPRRPTISSPAIPSALAQAMVKLVDADRPPLRMPFGTDTLAAIARKNAYVTEETAQWRELAASTDFSEARAGG